MGTGRFHLASSSGAIPTQVGMLPEIPGVERPLQGTENTELLFFGNISSSGNI